MIKAYNDFPPHGYINYVMSFNNSYARLKVRYGIIYSSSLDKPYSNNQDIPIRSSEHSEANINITSYSKVILEKYK